MSKIYLANPCYGGVDGRTVSSIVVASKEHEVGYFARRDSILGDCFNKLWAECINSKQWDYFAMIHSDVGVAEPFWLDILHREMQRTKADFLSAVVYIKDDSGDTSTAVFCNDTKEIHRLKMKKLHKLPTTFDVSSISSDPLDVLLLNTGLWICDLSKPWVRKVFFEMRTTIFERPDGVLESRLLPEDWNFSMQAAGQGVKGFATRAVTVRHFGDCEFRSDILLGKG